MALGHKSVRELVGVTMDGSPIPGDSCTFPLLIEDDGDDAASPVMHLSEGSATIRNHVEDLRNHWNQSRNHGIMGI